MEELNLEKGAYFWIFGDFFAYFSMELFLQP
jgi:hypothetical protein